MKEKCPWCDFKTSSETDAYLHLVYFHSAIWTKLAGEYKKGSALQIMHRLNQPRDRRGRLTRLKDK